MIFHGNHLLADNSHDIPYLIFLKIEKDVAKLSSAAVVTGTLRVKLMFWNPELMKTRETGILNPFKTQGIFNKVTIQSSQDGPLYILRGHRL